MLDRDDLARLREVTASQGLMLESISERLMETVHAGSPTKHPARRLETIRAAGELKIPFTSGILVGIGETADERIASLEALAEVHAEHGHIQEVILQNFVPHERYYGERAGADRRRGRAALLGARAIGEPAATLPLPEWACEVTIEDMKRLVGETRAAAARRRHPGPAEPRRLVAASSSRPAPPTSAACPPTATTSRPSTPSRRRTRCASACRPTASR